jgi:hypothetical protein
MTFDLWGIPITLELWGIPEGTRLVILLSAAVIGAFMLND